MHKSIFVGIETCCTRECAIVLDILAYELVYNMCTSCLPVVYKLSTSCLQLVYNLSTTCLQVVYKLSTTCLQVVYKLSTSCIQVVYTLSTIRLQTDQTFKCNENYEHQRKCCTKSSQKSYYNISPTTYAHCSPTQRSFTFY